MILFSGMSFRYFGTALALLVIAPMLYAQSAPAALNIAARAAYIDVHKVVIRWAPMDFETWKWGNTQGYTLERYTIIDERVVLNGSEYEASRVELGTEMKPLPENQWESIAASDDLAGVAAGAIYGDSLE